VSWIVVNIRWIMILPGVLTMTMVTPRSHLKLRFVDVSRGRERGWSPISSSVTGGALVALVGAMLVYGARKPPVRPMALTVAGASKEIFVALVLSHRRHFLGYQAGIAVLINVL
jgi:hypothetical protein